MKRLSIAQVKAMNGLLGVETGHTAAIRDEELLERIINAPWQTYDGEDVYRGLEAKAARLAYGFIDGRPFRSGNARIGMLAMLTLLEINGVTLHCNDEAIVETARSIERGEMTQGQLMLWIREHC